MRISTRTARRIGDSLSLRILQPNTHMKTRYFETLPRLVLFAAYVFSAALVTKGEELKHFNPAVLGQRATSTLTLLLGSMTGVEPTTIQVDIEDGKCYA